MSDITLDEQLTCVRREIAMRQRVYPKWVTLGKLSAVKADHELLCMQAVLETLLRVQGIEKDYLEAKNRLSTQDTNEQ
ncbi:MAG: hypothetical protein M3436_00715 [Pseudomonadota bacterium]|nr:hypothetical protein [Pseudomonadota bacterium]